MQKENDRLSKRDLDMQGILDSGELGAKVQFLEDEIKNLKRTKDKELIEKDQQIEKLTENTADMEKDKKTVKTQLG